MEINTIYSFQVDSPVVKEIYCKEKNYLIEYSETGDKRKCIIYFSSNDIYYPNTEESFRDQLVKRNRFEWYQTRLDGCKHIFIRDICKQWYLNGINSEINTPEKLIEFLKKETEGFDITVLGSSAGGFASVIYGQLLGASRIYSFNGQFEVLSILNTSKEETDPLIFRYRNNKERLRWYDTRNFIQNPSAIYYFQSTRSVWDSEQYATVKHIGLHRICFNTSNHGIPFLKTNLPYVLGLSGAELDKLTSKTNHPVLFSIRSIGVTETIKSLSLILSYVIKKVYINIGLKLKSRG